MQTKDTTLSEKSLASSQLALKKAYLLLEQGDIQDAMDCAEEAITLAPNHPTPYLVHANILCAVGFVQESMTRLQRARKKWPQSTLAHLYFAEACILLSRIPQAKRALHKAQRSDKNQEHREYCNTLSSLVDMAMEGEMS
mgnify:CR=1 FL=1